MSPSPIEVPDAARAAWASIVGDAHVIADALALTAAGTATFATAARVPLIVRPETR